MPLKLKEAKLTIVNVVDGDITQIKTDAVITAINPTGMWFGGLDAAIQRSSGYMFHGQAQAAMPLSDGQVVYAPDQHLHNGKFGAVLFVVDGLEQPLYDLVTLALEAAVKHELLSVNIPSIRTGVMAGVYEPRTQALSDLARAVGDFVRKHPGKLDEINIVVYNSEGDRMFLRSACSSIY
jgi:O-acetyl-ADP-ribose deacetylase (regulator of RNase III)